MCILVHSDEWRPDVNIERVERSVIENKLLAAIEDDSGKVALVLNRQETRNVINALRCFARPKDAEHGPELLKMADDIQKLEEAAFRFTCRECGGPVLVAPDWPEMAVCPEHCSGHEYKHDRGRRGWFCEFCDHERDPYWGEP